MVEDGLLSNDVMPAWDGLISLENWLTTWKVLVI